MLVLTALSVAVLGGSAFADSATITSGATMTVTDCAAGKSQAGQVKITRDGGNQFADNTPLTVTGSNGKVSVSGNGNSGTGNANSFYSFAFTTTVDGGITTGTHTVTVKVEGLKKGANSAMSLTAGTVTVTAACDSVAPTVTYTPASVSVPADKVVDDKVGANVTFTITASDNLDPSPKIACGATSGSFFAVGDHTVECTATDATGNVSAKKTLPVTVTADQTKPTVVVTPAGPLTVAADSQKDGVVGASVSFTPTATDNVSPAPTATCDKASGTFFAVGEHKVTCSAKDVSNNVADDAVLTITITPDTTVPVATITTVGPVEVEANTRQNGVPGATVAYAAEAKDTIDPAPALECNKASGSFFTVGSHTVSCTATDSSKNVSQAATLTVNVGADKTAPVVTFDRGAVSVEADTKDGAIRGADVQFGVSATDAVDGSPTPSCDAQPGFFPVGTTLVTCTATDEANNVSSKATLSITVTPDATAPVVTISPAGPLNVLVGGVVDGKPGRTVSYTASASDGVDGALTATCSPVSGSFFQVGTTVVTCSATDGSNNTGSKTLSITVAPDTTAPVLSLPTLGTLEATGATGRKVDYTVTATDDSTVAPLIVCIPASGSDFGIGDTTVKCSAVDASANAAHDEFTVTVADTTGPALTGPTTVDADATGPLGAVATFSVTASDLVSGSAAVTCTPASGTTFQLGTTSVSCSAKDHKGLTGTHELTVKVTDRTAPAVTVPANFTAQATDAGGVVVAYAAIATDGVDGFINPTCAPSSGATFPVGGTTVTCSAVDKVGNTGQASFTITVLPVVAQSPPRAPSVPDVPVDTPAPPRPETPREPKEVPNPPVAPAPQPEPGEQPPAPPAPSAPGPIDTPNVELPRGENDSPRAVGTSPRARDGGTTGDDESSSRRERSDVDDDGASAGDASDAAGESDTAAEDDGRSSSDNDDAQQTVKVPEGVDLDASEMQAGAVVDEEGRRLLESLPGRRFRFVASGFAPFTWVVIELHSTPVRLARVRADRNGIVDVELTLADGVEVGEHDVVAVGKDTAGRTRDVRVGLTVLPVTATTRNLPTAVMWAVAGTLLLVVGARAITTRAARRSRTATA